MYHVSQSQAARASRFAKSNRSMGYGIDGLDELGLGKLGSGTRLECNGRPAGRHAVIAVISVIAPTSGCLASVLEPVQALQALGSPRAPHGRLPLCSKHVACSCTPVLICSSIRLSTRDRGFFFTNNSATIPFHTTLLR